MLERKPRAIALGFFDGVHLGHQALLRRTVERAGEQGLSPAMFTFDRSPKEFVTGRPVPLITNSEGRQAAVEALFPGMEVIVVPFDREMMEMPWQDFVHMLRDTYGAEYLVAGHDFHFGSQNQGTPELLQQRSRQLGMGCDIIPAVELDGQTVSSTRIRHCLLEGDVETAARLLGRPFSLIGVVEHGRGLGHRLGTPTLNTVPPEGQMCPAYGVYVTRVTVEGETFPAVTNIGVRPTVDSTGRVVAESHLLDCDRLLYGRECRVEVLQYLRPEHRFEDLKALSQQIAEDADRAREYFRSHP